MSDKSAFPHHDVTGMTLRDYFAAAALANPNALEGHVFDVARSAYNLADAMMAVRMEARK